jgi:hypothetical protein
MDLASAGFRMELAVDLFGDALAFPLEAEESCRFVFQSEVSGSGAGSGSGVVARGVALSILVGLAIVGVTAVAASRSF